MSQLREWQCHTYIVIAALAAMRAEGIDEAPTSGVAKAAKLGQSEAQAALEQLEHWGLVASEAGTDPNPARMWWLKFETASI
jgi:hypothetical protein